MSELPIFVVRPSGVWNTRSPLNSFMFESNSVTIAYSVLTLAIARTRYMIDHRNPNDSKTSLRKYLETDSSGRVAEKAWNRYRGAWRTLSGRHDKKPSFDDFDTDLSISLYAVRENSIARYSSIFETFVQCWALNMLLSYLESERNMPKELQTLAHDFSPFRQRFTLPTVPVIFEAFESINHGLDKLPHISKDPTTGNSVSEPIAPGLNAKSVVLFWRDFRNSIVHHSGLVTYAFCNKYFALFEALRQPYTDFLRPLEPGTRLQLPDIVFSAMSTTHLKTATWLNEHLQALSENRGRILYEESTAQLLPMNALTPLLAEGDHSLSLRWLNDSIWRDELLGKYPRKWHIKNGSSNA